MIKISNLHFILFYYSVVSTIPTNKASIDSVLAAQDTGLLASEANQWIKQLDVHTKNFSSVRNIAVPNIQLYIGIYLIVEKHPTTPKNIDYLKINMRNINVGLSRTRVIAFLSGVAFVPPMPPSLSQIDAATFESAIKDKLQEILKAQSFDPIIMVFTLLNKPSSLESIAVSNICGEGSLSPLYWEYNNKVGTSDKLNRDDRLFQLIVARIGGCTFHSDDEQAKLACTGPDNQPMSCYGSIFESSISYITKEQNECLATQIGVNLKSLPCGKTSPDVVADAVCSNGIVEGGEECDCVDHNFCDSECTTYCIINNESARRYVILVAAALTVTFIIVFGSLFIIFYLRRLNNLAGSRTSIISLPGGSKTDFSFFPIFATRTTAVTRAKSSTKSEALSKKSKSSSEIFEGKVIDLNIHKLNRKTGSKLKVTSKSKLQPPKSKVDSLATKSLSLNSQK